MTNSPLAVDSPALESDRILHLVPQDAIAQKTVLVVGLGSGGAAVCDHLTMAGVKKWILYDPDVLDGVNLVKHPRMRTGLGRNKAELQREWILDRNPTATVQARPMDVFDDRAFAAEVASADLVVSCPDTRRAREFVNDVCVRARKPMVVGLVFRRGIGGEVFAYLPGETGCFRCLELYALQNGYQLTDESIGLTDEEERRIYGMGETEFRTSGLSTDIQMIAAIHARVALSILLQGVESSLPRIQPNWIIMGTRPFPGVFQSNFETKQVLLRPQNSCNCAIEVPNA